MNKILAVILTIILTLGLLLGGCSTDSEPLTARVGEPAPDFQLENLDGQTVSLGDLKGKPILINFWTTWCSSCAYEMPYIQQVHEEWSDKRLAILAVNLGESSSHVRGFVQSYNLSLTVLLDPAWSSAQKYNVVALPTTFLIDKDGIVQAKLIGAFPSKEAIEGKLSKIIP